MRQEVSVNNLEKVMGNSTLITLKTFVIFLLFLFEI